MDEELFFSLILKALPKEYENLTTLMQYSKNIKTLKNI